MMDQDRATRHAIHDFVVRTFLFDSGDVAVQKAPDASGQSVVSEYPCLGLVPDGGATQRCGGPGPAGLDASCRRPPVA